MFEKLMIIAFVTYLYVKIGLIIIKMNESEKSHSQTSC